MQSLLALVALVEVDQCLMAQELRGVALYSAQSLPLVEAMGRGRSRQERLAVMVALEAGLQEVLPQAQETHLQYLQRRVQTAGQALTQRLIMVAEGVEGLHLPHRLHLQQ